MCVNKVWTVWVLSLFNSQQNISIIRQVKYIFKFYELLYQDKTNKTNP